MYNKTQKIIVINTADITALMIFIIIYKYSTQTYKQAIMCTWRNHVIIVLVEFSITAMAILHLEPVIFGGNDKTIVYLRSHGLLRSSKSCARYLKIHEYICCACL